MLSEIFCHSSQGWICSLSSVQASVLAIRRPVRHNPFFDDCVHLQQSLSQTSGPFSTSCFALQHLDEETQAPFFKCATFLRLVPDPFGRVPKIAYQFRAFAYSDNCDAKADLVYHTEWCLSRLFLLVHLLHLNCLCFLIVVPAKENLVDHVCLLPLPVVLLSCLKLHESPLEHCPLAIHCPQS